MVNPPPMTDALIERLEARLAYKGIRGVEEELMHEAAQALKAKDAEIAELREAIAMLRLDEAERQSLRPSDRRFARKALGGSDND